VSDCSMAAGTKVTFISASVGAGHNSAARALMAGLTERLPELPIEFLDTMTITSGAFRALYAGGYMKSMTHAPWLWGAGYRIADRRQGQRHSILERGRLAFERLILRKLRRHLLNTQPEVIVNTHFLAAPVVGRMVGAGALRAKHYVVVTDILAHRFWYTDNVDRYFVASQEAAETIRSWGVDPQRVCHSGIPIHPKWLAPADRAELLGKWDLPADKRIVILAGGAQFTTGPVARMARDLVLACPDVFVAVLAGRNNRLIAELAELAGEHGRVRGIPMTDRAQELVELCSLMITKAGGITTAECSAKGKPMVFLRPVPGQESGNAKYYVQHGAAVMAGDWSDVAATAAKVLGSPQRLESLAANAKKLYLPATQTIVGAIVQQLSNRQQT